jgi:hypothetical protein
LLIVWLFNLGSFFKKNRSSQNCWATFYHGTSYLFILKKMGRATFWAIFSPNSSGHPTRYLNLIEKFSWRNSDGSCLNQFDQFVYLFWNFRFLLLHAWGGTWPGWPDWAIFRLLGDWMSSF